MDNLQAHKSARVRLAIEAKGCLVLFLPSYSPGLSPIEEAFSKLKTALRRIGARTREALEEAIGQALHVSNERSSLSFSAITATSSLMTPFKKNWRRFILQVAVDNRPLRQPN